MDRDKRNSVLDSMVSDMVGHLMRTPYTQVKQFHEAYGQPVSTEQKFPSAERMELRKTLIREEVQEFMDSCDEGDYANALKELADIIYVVEGTFLEMGASGDAVFNEVHRSNMSKLDADGNPIYREDGKVLKGPNYFEADIKKVLRG